EIVVFSFLCGCVPFYMQEKIGVRVSVCVGLESRRRIEGPAKARRECRRGERWRRRRRMLVVVVIVVMLAVDAVVLAIGRGVCPLTASARTWYAPPASDR
ncbi:unnamed protein product, partial [Scytosiphon promiscuus]